MLKFLAIICPVLLLANDTDIIPRTVNFLIFAGLMYYWTAKHFKNLYKSRIELVTSRLCAIEQQLDEVKRNKDDIAKRIEKANKDAEEIIETAKHQANKLAENIKKSADLEVENLSKQYEEQKKFEKHRVKMNVINELVDEMLNTKLNLSQDELMNIISKKVG